MKLDFFVPGTPTGKARPRFGRGGVVFTPRKTHLAETAVALAASREMQRLKMPKASGQPVTVAMEIRFKMPAAKSRQLAIESIGRCAIRKPDIDNTIKLVLDGMNGVVFHDDAQVCGLAVIKRYVDDEPGVYVSVEWSNE